MRYWKRIHKILQEDYMYLDPGFGSLLIQGIIGAVAVMGSSFFLFRQKIKAFFSRNQDKAENAAGEEK
ncbi:MAG: hypothetical protein LBC77_00870 [Spirochaetaceae bacterium]|nr:hypothetical protein [Spirochaetaceae bacterium]